jgi:cell division protein FtsI/penicillin-binding protein 2
MTGLSLYDRVDGARRRRRVTVLAVVAVVVGGGVAAWWFLRPVPEDPRVAATALAAAWADGRIDRAPFDTQAPDDVAARHDAAVAGLDAGPPRVRVVDVTDPAADDDPLTTDATLGVTWALAGERSWSYETTATLVRAQDELTWSVVWSPSLLHPRLTDDLGLRARRTRPTRGEVLAEDGTPLVTERDVVDVGIQPSRVEDLDRLLADLAGALDRVLDVQLDTDALAQRIGAADADAFVSVLTLREDDYLRVQDQVQPLPGTVFGRRSTPLAPTSGFARFTLGRAGPVTAEMIAQHPDRYVAGDVAGRSGLQAVEDERLFGTPGLEVLLDGEQTPEDPVLFAAPAVDGEDVVVTLDERVQRAADDAVEGTDLATGLAVVRPSDGHVLALANSPEATFDLARTAQVPPGSTFKVVTTQALLDGTDLQRDTPVACPGEVAIGGRTITNAESQQLGTVPFETAFVNSCNTAFVQLAQDLGPGALRSAARRFGIGREAAVGMDAFTGEVPETGDAVDLAATAIGQGRTLVSPLAMAGAMAAIAEGGFPGLSLVLEPAPVGAGSDRDDLPEDQARLLQELTRGVVTDGTGTALAGTPGGPVHGKTGTAEFTAEDGSLRTHAWFVGYQGDLAVAVVVTDTPGAYGGQVAAPVARRLLTTLAGDGS